MAVGQGMVGMAAGSRANDGDLELCERLLSAAATTMRCTESQLDAVTAISGSGPAYVFHIAECMVAAATKVGLSQEQAHTLVGQTISGSIAYLKAQEGFPAGTLRQQVTSPGGTTAEVA